MKLRKNIDSGWTTKIWERIAWLILEFSYCFILLISGPLKLCMEYKSEFWFSVTDILPVVTKMFLYVLLLAYVGGWILRKTPFSQFFYVLLLCFLAGFFIQENVIAKCYSMVEGGRLVWLQEKAYYTSSILLWGAVAVGLGLTLLVLRSQKRIEKVGVGVCVVLVVVEFALLGIDFSNTARLENDKKPLLMVSDDGALKLSKNSNVVTFILGSSKGSVELDDFTSYPDAVSGYSVADGNVPLILTGKWYESNMPYSDYLMEAYQNTALYSDLESRGYSVGVYTDSRYLADDNFDFMNVSDEKCGIGDTVGFVIQLYKLMAYHYIPHQCLDPFIEYTGEFEIYRMNEDGACSYSTRAEDFYRRLTKEKLSVDKSKGAFRVYFLEEENAGTCASIIEEYCEQLKRQKVYDNTSIVILSGEGNTQEGEQRPLFMLKEAKETHPFAISDESVSYEEVQPILKTLIAGKKVADYFQEKQWEQEKIRRFLKSTDRGEKSRNDSLAKMKEYYVVGIAADEESWIPMGNIYSADGQRDLEIGLFMDSEEQRVLMDESSPEYQALVQTGLSVEKAKEDELACAWTSGKYSEFLWRFPETFSEDLKVTFSVGGTFDGAEQRVLPFANGIRLPELLVKEGKVEIEIPNFCIDDSRLDLILYYPGGEDVQAGNDNDRSIFSLQDIVCEKTKLCRYMIEDTCSINVSEDNSDFEKIAWKGFSNPENSGVWIDGKDAVLSFAFPENYEDDFRLILSVGDKMGDSQPVVVYANGLKVDDVLCLDKEIVINIENALIKDGSLLLELSLPGAVSAVELKTGTDERKLAYFITGILCERVSATGLVFEDDCEIEVSKDGTMYQTLVIDGGEKPDDIGAWFGDKDVCMRISFQDDFQDDFRLRLKTDYVMNGSQSILASVNGYEIYSVWYMNDEIVLDIPNRYLLAHRNDIRLSFPDSVSAQELGTGADVRKLAYRITSIACERRLRGGYLVKESEEIAISDSNPDFQRLMVSGFAGTDGTGVWTTGGTAMIALAFSENFDHDVCVVLKTDNEINGTQKVTAKVNGRKLVGTGYQEGCIVIPILEERIEKCYMEINLSFSGDTDVFHITDIYCYVL